MADKIIKYKLFDGTALAGLAVLTTPPIDIRSVKFTLSLRVKATSATNQGAVDFKIDYAVSDYGPRLNMPDLVQQSVEDYDQFTGSFLTTWSGTSNPTDWQVLAAAAPLAPFLKFRFTGLGANPSDTLLWAKYIVQEGL